MTIVKGEREEEICGRSLRQQHNSGKILAWPVQSPKEKLCMSFLLLFKTTQIQYLTVLEVVSLECILYG